MPRLSPDQRIDADDAAFDVAERAVSELPGLIAASV